MSVALQFKLTTTGAAACWNANNTGLSLNLTHIQLGSGNRAPTGTETALVTPQQAVPIAAGFSVSNTQIRMSSIFSGSTSFVIREVGLWAGDPAVGGSKLIGYWSQASGDLAVKSSGVDFIFAHDMIIDGSVPAGSLTIQADAAQSAMLAMIMGHEAKPDAHPQYEKILDGIAPWSASIAYANNAFTKASTGKVYRALSANTNKDPSVATNNSGGTAVWTYCPMVEAEIGSALQSQTYTSFTTTGTAPSYIGLFIPAAISFLPNLRAQVTFHAGNNGAASTLNVNGTGNKPIKQIDPTGMKDTYIVAGQKADLVSDGTNWIVIDPIDFNAVRVDKNQPNSVQFTAPNQAWVNQANINLKTPWVKDVGGANWATTANGEITISKTGLYVVEMSGQLQIKNSSGSTQDIQVVAGHSNNGVSDSIWRSSVPANEYIHKNITITAIRNFAESGNDVITPSVYGAGSVNTQLTVFYNNPTFRIHALSHKI